MRGSSVVLYVFALAAADAGPVAAQASLVGVWGSETVFGPVVRGTLTISRAADGLRATIAGRGAAVTVRDGRYTFALDSSLGSFRGALTPDGKRIRGHWIQPGGENPTPYATPVDLRLVARDRWQGEVVPHDDRFSLYLNVAAGADGALTGSFHNPEYNFRGGSTFYNVFVDGRAIHLAGINDTSAHIRGTYDPTAGRITIAWDFPQRTFQLTRRDRAHALGYFAFPSEAPYTYRAPAADADGWRTGAARTVGLDEARLAALVRAIADTSPTSRGAPSVHSVLVARRGTLVLEEYFRGFDRERPHDLRSASKTFASVLVGVARDRGARIGPETAVYASFPEYDSTANPDPRKAQMTLAHLMTMSSGLACDDNDNKSPGNEGRMQGQPQADWYRYTLDLPLVRAPGEKAVYCSAGVNLIGGMLRNITGEWLPDFFRSALAAPLGFHRYHINLTPTGDGYAGGGVQLRPRDLLKVGQVYLDRGTWNGRRIVSAEWVDRSVKNQVATGDSTWDGYDWHITELVAGGRRYREYEANGNGGQFLIVVPEAQLVVVFTAGNYGSYGVWRKFRDELVPRYVLEAISPR